MRDDSIYRNDAVRAVSALASTMSVCLTKDECVGMKRMQDNVVRTLMSLPSAEPEIIRCRDCKWSEEDPDFPNEYYCDWHHIYNEGEHWCSNGERAKG